MSVTIRWAGPDDAAVVHRLTQAAFAGQETLTPPSGAVTETEDVVREQLAARAGLVAYLDGVPVGCLRFVADERLHVRRVAVDSAYRGRGICTALMRHAEDAARAEGRRELWLGVRDQLPDNLAIYRHLGYAVVREHDFWVELRKELSMEVRTLAERAKAAAADLALLSRATKDAALHAMADALVARTDEVLTANAADLDRGTGLSESLRDRLRLTPERVAAMAAGLRDLAALPDPVGEVVRGSVLPNGLELRQVRVPLGVVGIVYEARPNVTVDAAGICLKSGNAVLLRGSSSAASSNRCLVEVLRSAGAAAGLPEDAVQLVEPTASREDVKELMRLRGLVDVLIPRGGADLIRSVVEESTVPVIETGVGNCHVYVDASADLDTALRIALNAKTSRPSVCNAAETLLVHADVAAEFLPRALPALRDAGVTVHGDAAVAAYGDVVAATEDDWYAEYLSLDLAVAVVPSLDAAVRHIRTYGSGHTEAIVTSSQEAARRFVATVDSAAVMVNASTRFTDGGEFGFGAEIGISTQKLHARGPMGLPELTSTKYVVVGDGQVR